MRSCDILEMENLHISLSKQQLDTFTATDTVLQKSGIFSSKLYLLISTTIKQLCTLLSPQQRTFWSVIAEKVASQAGEHTRSLTYDSFSVESSFQMCNEMP